MTPAGLPYEGIAVRVRAMAHGGYPAYMALWQDRACHWCGITVDPALVGQHLGRTFDHVVPRADRGGDGPDNLLNACLLCNNVRDRREAGDFSKVAELVVRPNRGDLPALGHALLAWGLVREARVAWGFAGLSRREANAHVLARLGPEAFDPDGRKGFEDLASALFEGHAREHASWDTGRLEAALAALPRLSELRRARGREAADAYAMRNAIARELSSRQAGAGPSTVP